MNNNNNNKNNQMYYNTNTNINTNVNAQDYNTAYYQQQQYNNTGNNNNNTAQNYQQYYYNANYQNYYNSQNQMYQNYNAYQQAYNYNYYNNSNAYQQQQQQLQQQQQPPPPPQQLQQSANVTKENKINNINNADADKKMVEMSCDSNYNMNPVYTRNILASEYFKNLYNLKDFASVLDEIKREVKHVEPNVTGIRMPSTAWCLLYKLFVMKLTKKQLRALINFKGNPLVRAMGFLFIRHVVAAKEMFDWFQPYLEDDELFTPDAKKGVEITIGEYVQKLLENHQYYGTLFRRIPVKIHRENQKKILFLQLLQKKRQENEKFRHELEIGSEIQALYDDGKYYNANIDKILDNDKYLITYTDYNDQVEVHIGYFMFDQKKVSPSRSKSKSKSRSSNHHRRYRHHRKRKYSRSRSRSSRHTRKGGKKYSKSRSRSRSSKRRRKRTRSRSKSPKSSAFVDLEHELRQRERNAAVARGRDYARRPRSYKQALSVKLAVATGRSRSRSPKPKEVKTILMPSSHNASNFDQGDKEDTSKRKKKASKMSEEQKRKLLELKSKYGDASAKSKQNHGLVIREKLKGRVLDSDDVVQLG